MIGHLLFLQGESDHQTLEPHDKTAFSRTSEPCIGSGATFATCLVVLDLWENAGSSMFNCLTQVLATQLQVHSWKKKIASKNQVIKRCIFQALFCSIGEPSIDKDR